MKFHCPELNCQIKKSCQAKSCSYNIKNPFSFNCMLFHINHTGSVTIQEIASFYGKDLSVVEKSYDRAKYKITCKILEQWLEEEMAVPVYYIHTKKLCVVCESLLEEGAYKKNKRFVYCSEECYNKYEPQIVKLSVKVKSKPEDLLKIARKKLKSIASMEKFFGISKNIIKTMEEAS